MFRSEVIYNELISMMKGDVLKKRTKEFAHRCVKLTMVLPNTQLGNHIRGQLIRCSTSVASNYRASCIAQSKASIILRNAIWFNTGINKMTERSDFLNYSLVNSHLSFILVKRSDFLNYSLVNSDELVKSQ